MTKEVTTQCEGSTHCLVNRMDEVCADVVCEASKCVGDYLAQQVKTLPGCPEIRTAFDASTEPLIAIAAYFARICTYSRISPETIICSYINLKKVVRDYPQFSLSNYNAHRLLVSSMMVFSKYYDDDIDSNARWARIAGVAVHELNCLEIDFLNLCQFDLRISYETFHNTVHELLCFHYHEPVRTNVPLFNPSATFYRQSEDSSSAPSPPCTVMSTPKSRSSLASFTRHSHHNDHDNHGHHGDDASDHSHSHRRKSLAILMNLFHRHHHHKSSHVSPPHEDHNTAPTEASSEHALHINTASNSTCLSPPTSPREGDTRPSSAKGMPRNHSNLSLSGLMHALSPSSKPLGSRKSHSGHHLEPEVDK